MAGPLVGVRVLEFEALGPAPFCGMLLADLGADVLTVERPAGDSAPRGTELLRRGKRSITLDLKAPQGLECALALVARADVLIEGMRPGVMERLGLGPEIACERNPRLVYGRMTGWGQSGPLAMSAGHDINFIALTGVLDAIGRPNAGPVPPLNVVGDYGGGGMFLAFGILAALLEARSSGRGQVVDAAMVDGASLLAAHFHGLLARGAWSPQRGTNVLDGGAPWYDVYETKDGRYMAVGAIEPQFYGSLLEKLGLDALALPKRGDRSSWPEIRAVLAAVFKTREREAWAKHFEGSDACVTPVLSFAEAQAHPHSLARSSFRTTGAVAQPAPGPRFSRTPAAIQRPPPARGEGAGQALIDWGLEQT
jgi:alpha-methylacyl-CoA racemase